MGQWRFPEIDTVPSNFAQALITFEDKRFPYHPGVDPLAIGRAFYQNNYPRKGRKWESTLSNAGYPLGAEGKAKNPLGKISGICMATRLELGYRKEEILALYASHAPFGEMSLAWKLRPGSIMVEGPID